MTQNRKTKANEAHERKLARNKEIEDKMRQDAIDAEGERLEIRNKDKEDYKLIRKADKNRKRHLNIEIASEIIDLITDVAEEAYDYLEAHKDDDESLITKPEWRQWLSIFTSGKKVSE